MNETGTLKRCPCRGDNLDKFVQPIILMILSRGSCSGYGIVKQLEHFPLLTGNSPDTTGVYRQIKTMEKRGAIIGIEEPDDQGAVKKRYEITDEGIDCLKNWSTTLSEYRFNLSQLIDEIDDSLKGELS